MKRLHLQVTKPIVVTAILLLCGFGFTNHHSDSPSTAVTHQSSARILIVLQKTPFKSELARILTEHYSPLYIEIADFSILNTVNPQDWSAIIILQSWEDWQPQPEITNLIKRADAKNKILVVTTSDTGQEKLEGIDAISSASMLDNARATADKIVARLEKVLQY